MKNVKSIQELRSEFESVKSVCCGETRFAAQALMFLCEIANVIKNFPAEKPIRKVSKKVKVQQIKFKDEFKDDIANINNTKQKGVVQHDT